MIARLRALVSQRELTAFFVLAYALSWWPSLITPHSIVPVGPLVAALAIAALIGGRAEVVTFLRRIVQWRAHAGWYGLVLLLPFATTAGAVALNRIWSALPPALERAPPLAELAPTFVGVALYIGLGEEPAWRGFALPRLMTARSPLVASAWLALLHGAWHAPLLGAEYHATNVVPWFIGLAGYTVLATVVYNRTRGSLLLPILFHASVNTAAHYAFGALYAGADLVRLWWLWAALWWAAALPGIAVLGPRLGATEPSRDAKVGLE